MARIRAIFDKSPAGAASTDTVGILDAALRDTDQKAVAIAEFDMDGTLRRAHDKFLKILPALTGEPGSDITLGEAMRSICAHPVMSAAGSQVGFAIEWRDRPQDTLTDMQVDAMLDNALDAVTDEIEHQSILMVRYAMVEAARDGGCEPQQDQARA